MVIAFDTALNFTYVSGSTTVGFNCTSAANRIMIVNTGTNVTSVTYNSVSLTKYLTYNSTISDGNGLTGYIWVLMNPDPGNNTLALGGTGSFNGDVGIATYSGVAQTGNPDHNATFFSNNGVNNTQVAGLSGSVTTTVDQSWTILCARGSNNSPRTFVAGASTTLRCSGDTTGGDGAQGILDSNAAITPAGSSTLTANWSSVSGFISLGVISIYPVSAGNNSFAFLFDK